MQTQNTKFNRAACSRVLSIVADVMGPEAASQLRKASCSQVGTKIAQKNTHEFYVADFFDYASIRIELYADDRYDARAQAAMFILQRCAEESHLDTFGHEILHPEVNVQEWKLYPGPYHKAPGVGQLVSEVKEMFELATDETKDADKVYVFDSGYVACSACAEGCSERGEIQGVKKIIDAAKDDSCWQCENCGKQFEPGFDPDPEETGEAAMLQEAAEAMGCNETLPADALRETVRGFFGTHWAVGSMGYQGHAYIDVYPSLMMALDAAASQQYAYDKDKADRPHIEDRAYSVAEFAPSSDFDV